MVRKSAITLIKQAAEKLEARDAKSALALYREALGLQPGNAAGLLGMVMAYNALGQYHEAQPLIDKLLVAVESGRLPLANEPKATVYAQAGFCSQNLGQPAKALAFYRMAYGLVRSEELARAISHLEQGGKGRSVLDQLLDAARSAHRERRLEDSAKAYQQALQINPDHHEGLYGLGMVLRDMGKLADALPLVQQAIILQPDIAEYYNGLGMIFQERGELEKAITFHRRALNLKPDFAGASCNIGVAYKRLGQHEAAINAYRAALAIDPNLPEAHNNIGNLLRILGRIDEARDELKRALALRPGYKDAAENLAALGEEVTPGATVAPVKRTASPRAPRKTASATGATSVKAAPASKSKRPAKSKAT